MPVWVEVAEAELTNNNTPTNTDCTARETGCEVTTTTGTERETVEKAGTARESILCSHGLGKTEEGQKGNNGSAGEEIGNF